MLNGPVGGSLVSLHISDQFCGARVPEGEEMEPIQKALILVFDVTDVELSATTCIKVLLEFIEFFKLFFEESSQNLKNLK